MNAVAVDPGPWPKRRWRHIIILVFLAQAGLIFWLSDYSPATARKPARAPVLEMAGTNLLEWVALTDPTLLVLPHEQGFAGLAWLKPWKPPMTAFTWTEGPQFLPLAYDQLGTAFARFLGTNNPAPLAAAAFGLPELALPPANPPAPIQDRTTLLITGDLARRRLLTLPELRAWPSTDLLTNSVVQMVVDASGRVVSLTLLASSLSAKADQFALDQARRLRFASVEEPPGKPDPMAGLTWGNLVFEWLTLPETPSTNSPAVPP